MNYVEWLRVRNCLRCTAIVLGILVVLAIVLRISVNRYMSSEAFIAHMAVQNGAKETQSVLPDGTKRMIIDDPTDQTHIVVDDHGYHGKHIVITEPTSRAEKERDNVAIGSVHISRSPHGTTTITTVDTNGAVPMIYYMALADVVALIVATILAAPLAREIDGHLEISLTKPVARVRYALGVIGVDVVGIIAASVLTIVAFYVCQLLFESARLDFSGINSRAIAMGIVLPLAWYAMLCAATTWLNRAYGAVQGFAWPVAIFIGVLAAIEPSNTIALFVHDVGWVLSRLDPLTYASLPHGDGVVFSTAGNFAGRLAIVALLFVVYSALAVWQWQRVEA
jgi:hypothetical protein